MNKTFKFKNLSQYSDIIHLITQKDSSKAYDFSLALHTKERPLDILQNRKHIQEQFPNMKFIVANQTHSSNIKIIRSKESLGWENIESAIENCDALISNQKGLMLTILTADCVPILLFDPISKVIGAVHAGWRGSQQKILLKTVQKMEELFNSNPENIRASIAPSIGKCCYEVDWEVTQHFQHIKNSYTKKNNNKYMLDLVYINKFQLLETGLKKNNIEISDICTSCGANAYFSYRKEQGCSGRFMSMIGLI